MRDRKTSKNQAGAGGAGPLNPGELLTRFAALEKGLRELRGHL